MNYPLHFVNMHKTALEIALDFITLSPKSQHEIMALLYLWKTHKSCLEYAYCTVAAKMLWGADQLECFMSFTELMRTPTRVFKSDAQSDSTD